MTARKTAKAAEPEEPEAEATDEEQPEPERDRTPQVGPFGVALVQFKEAVDFANSGFGSEDARMIVAAINANTAALLASRRQWPPAHQWDFYAAAGHSTDEW